MKRLTDHELKIMQIFWSESPLTVQDVLDRFERRPKPAYTSLLTAVRGLAEKGFLAFEKVGKAYHYKPKVNRQNYLTQSVSHLLQTTFEGDARALVANLFKAETLSDADKAELKRLVEEM
jgi:predicted transcriptional regulator